LQEEELNFKEIEKKLKGEQELRRREREEKYK